MTHAVVRLTKASESRGIKGSRGTWVTPIEEGATGKAGDQKEGVTMHKRAMGGANSGGFN